MEEDKKENNINLLAENYLIDLPTGGGPGAYDDTTVINSFKAGYIAAVKNLKCCTNCKYSRIMYSNTYDHYLYCKIHDLIHPDYRCREWEEWEELEENKNEKQ